MIVAAARDVRAGDDHTWSCQQHAHHPPPRSTFGHMKETAQEGFRLAMARQSSTNHHDQVSSSGVAEAVRLQLRIPSVINHFDFPDGVRGNVVRLSGSGSAAWVGCRCSAWQLNKTFKRFPKH